MYRVEDYFYPFSRPFYQKVLQDGSIPAYMPWRTKPLDDLRATLLKATTKQESLEGGGLGDIEVLVPNAKEAKYSTNPIYRCGIENQDAFIITRYCLDRLIANINYLDEILQNT